MYSTTTPPPSLNPLLHTHPLPLLSSTFPLVFIDLAFIIVSGVTVGVQVITFTSLPVVLEIRFESHLGREFSWLWYVAISSACHGGFSLVTPVSVPPSSVVLIKVNAVSTLTRINELGHPSASESQSDVLRMIHSCDGALPGECTCKG